MANKKYVEQRVLAAKEEQLLKRKKRLRIFPLIMLVFTVIMLLMLLVDWAAVYNTTIADNEVSISGFNCVAAGLSGNYSSADKGSFGDMAVPFNYYAATFVKPLCALTVVLMFVIILHLLIEVFASITNKQGAFNILAIVFTVAEAVLMIVCYAVALSMKDAKILSDYCSNNPACSIQSHAIIPAILAILSLACPILAIISEYKIKKDVQAAMPAPPQEVKRSLEDAPRKKK